MVQNKYKPVGMNQINAELTCTIAEELVKPERPPGRNLRQIVSSLEYQEALSDQLCHPRTVCCLELARIVHDSLEFPLPKRDDHRVCITYHVTS